MLTIYTGSKSKDCQGLSRRDFIKVGSLGLGGLSLASLLRTQAHGSSGILKDKAVVMVFLGGGASHIETFNPNMNVALPYRSMTNEVKTTLPGVTFGGTFPQLATHAKRLAIVRSFRHSVGSHGGAIRHVLTGGTSPSGKREEGFAMGSLYAKLRGVNHPKSGLPTYSLLTAPETDNQYRTEKSRVTTGSAPGILGAGYAPFNPSGKGAALDNMKLKLSVDRLDERQLLLRELDLLRRDIDTSGMMAGFDKFGQQAVDLVLGGASKAFDLTTEDPRTLEQYDTSMFRVGNYARRPQLVRDSTIGHQMLLARRLVERGCGFVTVQSAGWDMHADGNNPNLPDGMEMLGHPLDKALSAFLEDIDQRGLSEKILLVLTGDFGRTPRINKRAGRDHWPRLCTLAFAGGGLNMGQVIGQSARNNDVPATEPISTGNLMATVMHTLFDVGTLRVTSGVSRELLGPLEAHRPIEELF